MPADRRLRLARGLSALLAAASVLVPATAARASEAAPAPTYGEPWFGPGLDWERDLPAGYAERLGETPSLYGQRVHYPLSEDDRGYLADFAELSAGQGAVALLTLEPQVALTELTRADAEELGNDLAALHERLDTHFLVRFAPEMNGSWTIWGQQPDRYVAAFRTVADAVHGTAGPDAEMVWAPAYGAGYPFGRAYGAVDAAGRRIAQALDTDGDGTVDDGDDPYGPYFPGARHVDWVGLSLYHYGDRQDFGNNAAPLRGELDARLADRFGYGVRQRRTSFHDRYASRDRPMLVETAALYNTAEDGGASELALKQAWWRQVLDATSTHPAIGAISWLELARPEAEIDDAVADWRATHTADLAGALRADLAASEVRLGPVTEAVRPLDEATKDGPQDGSEAVGVGGLTGALRDWVPVGLAVLAAGWVVSRLVRRRARS